ncbi:MAG: SAM-dependent DNA methyltransferase, partial [Elusimicrobia bacterium]|nr:SAM-dependent DNA methyltransferase [Elusimicrobiota bacterium]
MTTLEAIEYQRLEAQCSLDAAKTRVERNKLGQFATPPALALDILAFANSLLPKNAKVRFLDPAFGTGSFYSALLRAFLVGRIESATGYEIDPHYGRKAQELWGGTKLRLELSDFTRARPPATELAKCNLLICNPPYVRHHHLKAEEKLRLQREGVKSAGMQLSGLAGLYCHFICLSHRWMGYGGIAGWLIPSEFMDVKYGERVKRYLLDRVTLLRIHRFDPSNVQFGDALVSSVVVWFKNNPPPQDHAVEFSFGGSLIVPKILKEVSSDALRRTAKWTRFPFTAADSQSDNRHLRISDLFSVKRGIATGANNFFIVDEVQAVQDHLPRRFLQPILPSPRHLREDEVLADSAGVPLLDKRLFLISCPLPESEVRSKYPNLWAYFQKGVEAKIH